MTQITFRTISQTLLYFKKELFDAYTSTFTMLAEQGSINLKMSALTLAEILVLIKHMNDFEKEDREKLKNSLLTFINVKHRTNIPVYESFDALIATLESIDA